MNELTIVIADDDADLVTALKKRCESAGLRVREAYDAVTALNVIHEQRPDLVCLDVNMPCGNGLSVVEMLAGDEWLSSTPVIIMTGSTDQEIVRRCHTLCAYFVEKSGDTWSRIEPIVRDVLAERRGASPAEPPSAAAAEPRGETDEPAASSQDGLIEVVFEMLAADPAFLERGGPSAASDEPPWVLCVDDDADFSHLLKLRLERYGVAVVRAFEGMEGVRFAFTRPADVILLDYAMPNGQGDYVLRRLKDNPVTKDIPVVMITGKRDRALERRTLAMGATRFMNKPLDFDELIGELRKHIDVLPRPAALGAD